MRKLATAAVLFLSCGVATAETRAVVPVVGSTAGAFGSLFKTELQLNNRSTQTMSGTLVFHRQGASAAPGDPSLRYLLEPHQTVHFEDVMAALSATGLGSMDIIADGHGVPTVVARAYDDNAEEGTAGTTVPALLVREVLSAGRTGWLLVPRDRARYRFNIGVRTLAEGVSASVTIYGANGVARKSITLSLPADYFAQQSGDAFVSDTLLANESIAFTLTSGRAVFYGTTTDNLTNDPSIQIAVSADDPEGQE